MKFEGRELQSGPDSFITVHLFEERSPQISFFSSPSLHSVTDLLRFDFIAGTVYFLSLPLSLSVFGDLQFQVSVSAFGFCLRRKTYRISSSFDWSEEAQKLSIEKIKYLGVSP